MATREQEFNLRLTTMEDNPALRSLMDVSVRVLQRADHSAEPLEAVLGTVYGVETQLMADGTYDVVEAVSPAGEKSLAASSGWSMRKTLYGSDHRPQRDSQLLDPARDAAKIRAFFVDPEGCGEGLSG